MRKGMALFALEEFETAQIAFEKGQTSDPSNSQFKTWIRKCQAELELDGTTTTNTTSSTQVTEDKMEIITPTPTEQPITPKVEAKPEPKFKHEWYQTTSQVVISVFAKEMTKEKVGIDIQEQSLCVTIKISETNDFVLDLELFDKVIPSESTTVFMSSKFDIKLKKASAIRWTSLEFKGKKKTTQIDTKKTEIAPTIQKNQKLGKNC